jgi:3-deoxy-7-phosphoheptulonate synthase
MKPEATNQDIDRIVGILKELNLSAHLSKGETTTIIGLIGDKSRLAGHNLEIMPGVDKLVPITESYKLANKKFHPAHSEVKVGDLTVGGGNFVIMSGPCAVESGEQLMAAAEAVKAGGAQVLRGGAYKPRTSPYSFQGLEEEGLRYMANAREKYGLKIVCEVTSESAVKSAVRYVDILQIGARNMQNYELLKVVGRTKLPVLLKRGLAATIDEWLNAAEYILSEGNPHVILCERGIRTFETATRHTLDISAIPVIKAKSHLPVIADPSHGTGVRAYVTPMAKAAAAAGADGLMIEVHPTPETAMSDGPQSLSPEEFLRLMEELRPLLRLMGKHI